MPTLYKNLWTVIFSHCQALNLPFKKFVICNLSSSQKFVNCNFYFNKFVNCNFLSLHCQTQSPQTQQTKLIQISNNSNKYCLTQLTRQGQENLTLFIIPCNITSSIFYFFSFPFFSNIWTSILHNRNLNYTIIIIKIIITELSA